MQDVRDVWGMLAGRIAKWRQNPDVVQAVRATAAATVAYVVAVRLSPEAAPLTAPLTALLVVQVTLYGTLTMTISRVNAVVTGVLIAIGFSVLVGLSWWSLGLIILVALGVGHLVRAGAFLLETAISAMLVLGVTQVGDTAWARVLETLIGALVGLLFNVLVTPPVWIDAAGQSIENLARRIRQLMLRVGEEAAGRMPVEHAAARLHEARRLDHEIVEVDADLKQAEDSLKLNPRVREGLLHRIVLRTGLDTLEICTVVLRVLARTFTDLAKARYPKPLFEPETGEVLERLLAQIGNAVVSFAVLVTTDVSRSAESAEARLTAELTEAAATRDKLALLLEKEAREDPHLWQLRGAVLTEVNRIIDELDTEHRSRRLLEELDRGTREARERRPRLTRLRDRLREVRRSWRNPSALVGRSKDKKKNKEKDKGKGRERERSEV